MSLSSSSSSPRRRIIEILLVLVAALTPVAIYRVVAAPAKYRPKYQTIAHRFLDLQARYDSLVQEDQYHLLDDIIDEVKSKAHYDPTIADRAAKQAQLLQIFNTIDSVLIERNFIFPPGRWDSTLGEALAGQNLSASEFEAALAEPHNARRMLQMKEHADQPFHLIACEPSAFLCMGIAQAMGFELKPVLVPKHIFVRAYLDADHWVNWDENRGRSIGDDEYARDWGVEDWQIHDGIYLHPLSTSETEGEMYCAIGACLADHSAFRGFNSAIACERKAVELNPRNPYGYADLAIDLLANPQPDAETRAEAMRMAERAVALQPEEEGFRAARAYAFAANGDTTAAASEMKKAVALNSKDPDLSEMLPLIESGHTLYTARQAQGPILFWIGYQHGWLYLLIGIVTMPLALVIVLIRRRIKRSATATEMPSIPAMTSFACAQKNQDDAPFSAREDVHSPALN